MGMYDNFKTDKKVETEGVWFEYDESFRVRLAMAGGANNKYNKLLEAKTKPHRRAAINNNMSDKIANALLKQVFAESVIVGWQVRDSKSKTGWKDGIEQPDGSIGEFSVENVLKVLDDLPSLWEGIYKDANNYNFYLQSVRATEAKN